MRGPTRRRRLWQTISRTDCLSHAAPCLPGADEKAGREHTEVVGEFLAIPVTGPQFVATVKRMLA